MSFIFPIAPIEKKSWVALAASNGHYFSLPLPQSLIPYRPACPAIGIILDRPRAYICDLAALSQSLSDKPAEATMI
jgi:hypothetical protein